MSSIIPLVFIFTRGKKIEIERFHGIALLQSMVVSDSIYHIAIGNVTFQPGARARWRLLPDGQIIMAISGVGYCQEQDSPKIIPKKGDVVTCPPDVPHLYRASADKEFIQ